MKIQAITKDNGFGLSKDIRVLRDAFEPLGHSVDFTPWNKPRRGFKYDWNIHLELLNPEHFGSARANALVPNPEWFNPEWSAHLGGIDIVLAKTKDAERIFSSHKRVHFTGWTTPDTSSRVDYGTIRAIHVAGDSISKGTEQVIEAARLVPELQVDVVVNRKVQHGSPNIYIHKQVNDDQLASLRKAPIHIQPSTYEGFGHVINEARAMGAYVITTGEVPMNELIADDYAIQAPVCVSRAMRLAREQVVCVDTLAECMRIAARTVAEFGPTFGARARAAYEAERTAFTERITSIIQ